MRVVALTGNIASGKSTVARVLRDLGATVIDLDAVVHELQRPGEPVYRAIVARFGDRIVAPDGTLDRAALRDLVFHDPAARHDLEAIVHPAVFERQRVLLTEAAKRREPLAIVEIPLLFEAADPMDYDGIILVDAPLSVRRFRLVARRGIKADEADLIMAAQIPSQEKRDQSTWVIDNTGDLAALETATRDVWKQLRGG